MSDTIAVGKIKEAHGLDGRLYVLLFSGELEWQKKMTTMTFIGPAGEQIVLTPDKMKPYRKGFLLKPKELTDRTAAEKLKGYLLMLPKEVLVSEPGESIYLNEILGFSLKLKDGTVVGEITSFEDTGAQDLLTVTTPLGEFSVPLVEQFIVNIDYESRTIEMDLPQGLLGEDT